jgi:two-component system, OmpR family, sensor kinase
MSLRRRLVLTLLGLLSAGLVVAAIGTFVSLKQYIIGRADRQLTAFGTAAEAFYGSHGVAATRPETPWPATALADAGSLPSFLQVRDPGGGVLLTFAPGGVPHLPSRLPAGAVTAANPDGATIRRTSGPGGDWRIRVSRLNSGALLVIGIPTRELDVAIKHTARVLSVVTVVTLLGVGLLAQRAIRRGMRPLEEIAGTARAIGGGDLSRRVEPADPRTEVGRLGQALNAMLGQIETAFREREASEERLRRFVADASHELRTPVATVRGYAELFRRGAAARPDDLAKAMHRIEAEAERMSVLVDELLLLARLDQGRPLEREPVDLTALAREAVSGARAVDPDRPVELTAPPEVVVPGDAVRLRQVLDNLLANVRRHTPPGTPATVDVSLTGGHATIDVTDQGPGVPAEHRERVFERFYRTDGTRSREGGGAGLGLSIVAAVVTAHDGTVTVTSPPGGGAMFRVRLPAPPEA